MAAGELAGSFQDEVTCSICLEYFTDPVTIECGHNFCRACLSQCWGEPEPNFSCPQCRETALQRDLRPHGQLGSLAELGKRLRLQAGPEPEGQRVGDRHQEALKLSCEEDQPPLCLVCDRSWAHRARMVVPMEEAAQEHRVGNSYLHVWELQGQLLCSYRAPRVSDQPWVRARELPNNGIVVQWEFFIIFWMNIVCASVSPMWCMFNTHRPPLSSAGIKEGDLWS
ncbi:unnamed protein product [Natator depressus]